MSYRIELRFGSTWEEIAVTTKDFQKTEVLHKNLRMADSVCTFSILPDITLYNKLRGISNNEVAIRIEKDNQPYFNGFIRKTFNIKKTQALVPVKIECVTPSFLLKRKVGYNLSYTNITVTQLLTNLLTTAGITLYTLPTISAVIPGFSVIAGQCDTYFKYIDQLLFEYGWVGYFDCEGRFTTYKIQPASITTFKIFNGSNCLNEINQIKKEEEKEKVVINWTGIETYTNKVVFSDTSNAQAGYKCYIELPPNGYLGGKEEWYAELDCPEGEVLSASSVSHDIIKDADIQVQKFEVVGNRVLVSVKNTSTILSRFIKKFDIIAGTVVVKKDVNRSMVIKVPNTEKIEDVEAEYIYSKTDGDYLANVLAWYYKYSDYEYRVSSKTEYGLGDVVQVSDYGIGTITGRIITKKSNEYSQTFDYEIEAIDEYAPDIAINETIYIAPTPSGVVDSIQTVVEAGLNSDGTLKQPINSNTMVTDIDPTGDGLYLTKSYIGLMQGYQWKSFIKNDGTFSFYGDANNYLTFSGGSLSVKGNADIAGKITASSGAIAGVNIASSKLYVGTGTFNNANTAFYLDNAGQLSLKDKLSWNGSTLSISGNITSTTGNIGGFTLGSTSLTGTNFTIANTGDITLGSANSIVRLSSSDATYGLWIGSATAASAPFRVTKTGVLTATGATISGAITATSGSFTGTISTSNITATGGTVGGFTINSSTVTGGSLSLTNTGNISAGTANDTARISADDATYRLWIGNATAASAPFKVSKTGVLTASGATISGAITATSGSFTGTITTSNITATGGTVGSWILGTDKLSSASTGSRIELNKAKSRVSIFDSGNNEKVVQGYLQGLLKNGPAWDSTKTYVVGDLVSRLGIVYKAILGSTNITPPNATYWQVSTDTWTASDYGFWISPSTTATFDGTIEAKNGGIIASDGGVKVKFGGLDSMLLGTENGRTGLHMNLNSTPVRLTGNSGGLALLMNNIDTSISSPTNVEAKWKDHTAFETSATKGFAFGDEVFIDSSLKLSFLSGIYFYKSDYTDYHSYIHAGSNWFSFNFKNSDSLYLDGIGSGVMSDRLSIRSSSLLGLGIDNSIAISGSITRYNYQTIGNDNISGYNLNNAEISVKSSTGTDSNTVYIKDGTGKLKERVIYSGVWTGAASTAGTCTGNAATSTKWATGRTIQLNGAVTGTSVAFDGTGNIGISTTLEAHTHTSSQISDASIQNAPNTIVKRNASGDFAAGTITASGAISGANIRIPTSQPVTLANGDIWMV